MEAAGAVTIKGDPAQHWLGVGVGAGVRVRVRVRVRVGLALRAWPSWLAAAPGSEAAAAAGAG